MNKIFNLFKLTQLAFIMMISVTKGFRLLTSRNMEFGITKIAMCTQNQQTTLASTLTINPSIGTQYVFVGGKGGVGKTSTSSAIAIALSDQGLRTLIVSTDPAHSLGDALDVNLSSGKIERIQTESNLWALEIDVDDALKSFKETANGLSVEGLSKRFIRILYFFRF